MLRKSGAAHDHFDVPADLRALCDKRSAGEHVCELSAAFGGVMRTIGGIVRQLESPLPLIVIVGDHAPPFVDKRSRSEFSATTVPAYVLEPKP